MTLEHAINATVAFAATPGLPAVVTIVATSAAAVLLGYAPWRAVSFGLALEGVVLMLDADRGTVWWSLALLLSAHVMIECRHRLNAHHAQHHDQDAEEAQL